MLLYNNVGLISKGYKDTANESIEITLSTTTLSFDAPCPGYPCKYLQKSYITRNYGPHFALIVCIHLHSNIRGGLGKTLILKHSV